jgi:CBS domain-containing protein
MKARDVMTIGVVTVANDASINEAIRLMLQRKISGLPVVDSSGALVGMVTEGDFLRRSELGTGRAPRWIELLFGTGKLAKDYVHMAGRKVHDVMTQEVYAVEEETSLGDVVATMERHKIKRVPVLRGSKLVGIVTRANLLHALAAQQHMATEVSSDITIRTKLMVELEKQPWAPLASVDITVRNGVVTLSGAILDDRQRQALRVAAENIPGVRKVVDGLVWIEPMSGMVIEPSAPAVRAVN